MVTTSQPPKEGRENPDPVLKAGDRSDRARARTHTHTRTREERDSRSKGKDAQQCATPGLRQLHRRARARTQAARTETRLPCAAGRADSVQQSSSRWSPPARSVPERRAGGAAEAAEAAEAHPTIGSSMLRSLTSGSADARTVPPTNLPGPMSVGRKRQPSGRQHRGGRW